MSDATGLSRPTLRAGRREMEAGALERGRIRRPGAGRPGIKQALEKLLDPLTRGDPPPPAVAVALDVQESGAAHGGAVGGGLAGEFNDGGPLAA